MSSRRCSGGSARKDYAEFAHFTRPAPRWPEFIVVADPNVGILMHFACRV